MAPDYIYGVHDFEAENPDEISFSAGDRIEVLERDDEFGDGWWTGRNEKGEEGLFPKSYTDSVKPSGPSQSSLGQTSTVGGMTLGSNVGEEDDIQQTIQSLSAGHSASGSQQGHGRREDEDEEDDFPKSILKKSPLLPSEEDNADSARKALQERAARNGFLEPVHEQRPASVKSKDSYGFDDESASEVSHLPSGKETGGFLPPIAGVGPLARGTSPGAYHFDEDTDDEGSAKKKNGSILPGDVSNPPVEAPQVHPSVEDVRSAEVAPAQPGLARSNTLASELRTRSANSPKASHGFDQKSNALDRFEARQRLGSPGGAATGDLAPSRALGSPMAPSGFREPGPISRGHTQDNMASTNSTLDVQKWSPKEVHSWLLARGFDAQTANVFLDQEISGDVLLEVDTNMLKEIGISAFGKRFQIMTAVKNLKASSNQSPMGSHLGESPRTPITHLPEQDRYTSARDLHENMASGQNSTQRSFSDSSGYRSFEPKRSQYADEQEAILTNRSVSGPAANRSGPMTDYFPASNFVEEPSEQAQTSRSTATLVGPQALAQATQSMEDEETSTLATAPAEDDRAIANRERYLEHLSQASATGIPNTGLAGSRAQQRTSDDMSHSRHRSGDSKGSRGSGRASMFGALMTAASQPVRASGKSGDLHEAAGPPSPSETAVASVDPSSNGSETVPTSRGSMGSMGNRIRSFGRTPKKAPTSRTRKDMIGSPLERPGSLKSESTVTTDARKTSLEDEPFEPSILSTIVAREQTILQQGWVRKKGDGFNVGWKVRYAVLTGNSLFILKSPEATKLKERVELAGYKVVQDDTIKYGFRLIHETNKRTHQLATDELDDRKVWVKTIMRCLIRRDWTQPVISSSNVPTISLEQAQAQYPPPRPPSPGKKSAARTSTINRTSQGALGGARRQSKNPRSDSPSESLENDGFVSADEDLMAQARFSGDQSNRKLSTSELSGDSDYITRRLQETDLKVAGTGPASLDSSVSSPFIRWTDVSDLCVQTSKASIDWVEYVNTNLPKTIQPIRKLSDLSNGIALTRLFETVSSTYRPASLTLPGQGAYITESKRLELVLGCFDFLADSRIDMNGISPNDVFTGNEPKIALLLSRIKSRYPSA